MFEAKYLALDESINVIVAIVPVSALLLSSFP